MHYKMIYYYKKSIQTLHNNYGVDNPGQIHIRDVIHLLGDPIWMYYEYITQQKTSTQIADDLKVNNCQTILRYLHKHNIEIRDNLFKSYMANQWIQSLIKTTGLDIQYDLNVGEYKIPGTRYSADGYCEETNTIYEFHRDYWHGNPSKYASNIWNSKTKCTMGELYERTIVGEAKLRELGYNVVVIWESEWNIIK